MNRYDQPTTLPVAEIRDEAKDIKTFFFDKPLDAKPGQFVMIWLPRVDLKPFGIAYLEDRRFGVTVSKVGPYTEKLFDVREGDLLGFTGPYGTPFRGSKAKRYIVVGGGYGAATIAPLVDQAVAEGKAVDCIVGAQTKDVLIYEQRYADSPVRFHAVTDDGSSGIKGRTTDVLEQLVTQGGVEYIAACGPEKMLYTIARIAQEKNIESEVSIERYMKCGFGVCGACSIDGTGERICVEGTVMSGAHALTLPEFGQYHRKRSGRKISV